MVLGHQIAILSLLRHSEIHFQQNGDMKRIYDPTTTQCQYITHCNNGRVLTRAYQMPVEGMGEAPGI